MQGQGKGRERAVERAVGGQVERAVSPPSSGLNRHMHMTLSGSSQSSLSSGWKFGSLRCKEKQTDNKTTTR